MAKRNKAKKKRQLDKSKMRSRNIPSDISRSVTESHFFECAWCSNKLTERHHITPWSIGGEHSVDNLILLCPTCHSLADSGKISNETLIKRKSTHLKGDRISGTFQTTQDELLIKMGNGEYENVKHLIAYRYEPILTIIKAKDTLLINARFYDAKGDLIFWMWENYFWAPSTFLISSSIDVLTIQNARTDSPEIILKIFKEGSYLRLDVKLYMAKNLYEIDPNGNMIFSGENGITIKELGGKASNVLIGFWVAELSYTEEEFKRINNENHSGTGIGLEIGKGYAKVNLEMSQGGKISFD